MSVEELVYKLRTHSDPYQTMIDAADKLEDLQKKNDELAAELETWQTVKHSSHWKERAEKAEAALAEAKWENEALRKLVDSAESIFINCSVTDGVCCCGDDMETHPSPMFCGHTPVDHGVYQVDLWLKARNAGGNNGE